MKNRHIIISLLIIFSVFILFSCGELTSPKAQDDTFSLTIDPALLSSLKRSGGDPEDMYRLEVALEGVNPADNYNPEPFVSENADPTQLQTSFLFNDIPLNIKLRLTVNITFKGEPVFTSEEREFTLKTYRQKTISLQLYRELNTPFMLQRKIMAGANQSADKYALSLIDADMLPEGSAAEWMTKELGIAGYSENEDCIIASTSDSQGNLWYIQNTYDDFDGEGNCFEALMSWGRGEIYPNQIITNEPADETDTSYTAEYIPADIKYDPTENLICIIAHDGDGNFFYAAETPNTLMTDYFQKDSDFSALNWKQVPFETGFYDQFTALGEYPQFAAEDGYLYAFWYGNIWKIDISTGNQVNTEPEQKYFDVYKAAGSQQLESFCAGLESDPYYYTEYFFKTNEMYAYRDQLFILFHERIVWCPAAEKGTTMEDTDSFNTETDYGFVERGGIFVLDTDSMAVKTIIGLPELQDSIDLPVYLQGTSHIDYMNADVQGVYAYKDADLTIQKTHTLSVLWGASMDGSTFCNPEKIVAIKPKKLIIADSGTFMYAPDDTAFDLAGYPYRGTERELTYTSGTRSRLVSVDLETFAVTELKDLGSAYYEPEQTEGFAFARTTECTGSEYSQNYGPLYGPKLEYNFRIEENGTIYKFTANYSNGGEEAASNFVAKAGVQFGF